MKSYKQMVNEVLTKMTPLEKWIDDFVHSKNAKFAGKSTAERIKMAKGAYYAKQNRESVEEAAAVSQNSAAEVDMNEDHLVHVSDGTGYDEVPHPKDIEHVKKHAAMHGGKWDSHSDKGAFFKFPSKEDAQNFISMANKSPHKTLHADLSEAVQIKEDTDKDWNDKNDSWKEHHKHISNSYTDYFDKDKRAKHIEKAKKIEHKVRAKHGDKVADDMVKHSDAVVGSFDGPDGGRSEHYRAKAYRNRHDIHDDDQYDHNPDEHGHIKEAVEYKGIGTDVVDKKKVLNPPIPLTQKKKEVKDFKEEVNEDVDKEAIKKEYKKNESDNRHTENAALLAKHFGSKHDQNQVAKAKAYRDKHNGFGSDILGRHHSNLAHEVHKKLYDKLHEEVELIDELSKDTLASYAKKASHDARIKQHVAADFKSKEAHARNPRKKETWGSIAKKYQSKAWKREDGHDKAVDKLAKESYDHDPIDRDAKITVGHKAAVLAGSGLDSGKHGTIVGSSKERTGDMWHIKTSSGDIVKMHKHRVAKLKEGVELIAKHEVKADAPHKSGGHVILTKSSNKWHVLHNKKSSPEAKDLHRSKLLHSYADEKEARAKFKELHEEQIDEISKSTLMRYIPKASRDVGSHTYAGKEAGEWAAHYTRAGDWAAADKQSKKSYADFKKANKRIAGIDTATKKLGTQKEETEQIDELSKGLVARYANKVAKTTQANYDKSKDKFQFSSGRQDGMKNAVKRLTKEEVELDEAIAKKLPVQHAVDAVHATLGPKSATRFLSHLKPGTEKHTSWDKVNSALVKQGVQTHHIASIAQKTSHMNEEVNESRGHKTLATFFKNREVAQRAYQGNPAKDAEVAQGGGTPADQGIAAAKKDAKQIKEDQYTAEYKIKYYVDPITGESKTRKIRPHRVNFKASKMHGEPAQKDAPDDYGIKEGFDDYHAIAKELVKRHGKNVDTGHISDIEGERDSHRPLDRGEVMHHVNKILGSKQVKEAEVHDDTWKEYKPSKQSIVKALKKIKGAK